MTIHNGLVTGISEGILSGLNPGFGPTTLLDLDFSQPAIQTFTTANATHEWQLQETSGVYADSVGSADLTVSGGLQGQTAVGIWDGSSFTGRKAWEATGNMDVATVGDSSIMDSDGTSIAVRAVFRTFDTSSSIKIWSKKAGSAAQPGILLRLSATQIIATISDGTLAFNAIVTETAIDGGWHYADVVFDATLMELRLRTGLGTATTDVTGLGSITNDGVFGLGDTTGLGFTAKAQVCYIAAIEGPDAESMDSEDFWTHATDTTGIITYGRTVPISVPVADATIAHYGANQLAFGYSSALDGNGLGLAGFHSITNLIDYSEDLTQWTATNATVTANDEDAPDGFRSACLVTSTAVDGVLSRTFTTTESTEYTISIWIKREAGSNLDKRLVFYDESNGAELASTAITENNDWKIVTLTATTNVGQVSSSLRIEIDTDADSFYAWGAQAQKNVNAYTGYVRTNGAAVTSGAMNISVPDTTYQYWKPESGEVWWEGIILDDNDNESKSFFEAVNTRNHDRRYFRDTTGSGGITAMVWDAAGRSAGQPVAGASIVKDTPLEIRYRWDVNGCPTSGLVAEVERSDTGAFASNGTPPATVDGTTSQEILVMRSSQPLRGLVRRLRIFDSAMESSV